MPRVTITIPESSPQTHDIDLKQEVVTIGRRDDNGIVISCDSVSGKHAEMRRMKGFYHLVDVGSTNGLNVNGDFQPTVVLMSGMTVILGNVKFGFSLNEDELAALTSELLPTATPVISADQEQAAKAEAEKAEAAKLEAAKLEAAKLEAVKTEAAQVKAIQGELAKAQAAQAQAELAKAEQAKAEQAKAEQAKAEQAKAEQAKAEQAKAEQTKAEQAKAEQAKAEQAKAEQTKTEQAKAEQAKAEQAKAEQAKAEQAKAEKKERENKEAIAKKADEAAKREKRKKSARPPNSDEYFESKTLKIGSGVTLFVLIAISAAFLYGGITHDRNGTAENIANTATTKDGTKNEAPKEVDDKPADGAK